MDKPSLLIVGARGGSNIGGSFLKAAKDLGAEPIFYDFHDAFAGPRLKRYIYWHMLGKRPPRINSFSQRVLKACVDYNPKWLLTTGLAPVGRNELMEIGRLGIKRINYSTDDPWNRSHLAPWFLKALPHYDIVYSVRRENIGDFIKAGCERVEYLPFGYDKELFYPEELAEGDKRKYESDIIFVGGADKDRLPYISALIKAGFKVALYGSYWDRYPETKAHAIGQADVETIRRATIGAKISLCLVRRANRDGHSMRSFEIPAIGACMLAEDTSEHRDIFGQMEKAVAYFKRPEEMLKKAKALLGDKKERDRMAMQAHSLVINGNNTYRYRLKACLEIED